jgi:hypothetical protein
LGRGIADLSISLHFRRLPTKPRLRQEERTTMRAAHEDGSPVFRYEIWLWRARWDSNPRLPD